MSNVDNFKSFVRKNPTLVTFVRNGTMSWQKFYELYDLYGEENKVWDDYLKKEPEEKTTASNSPSKSSLSIANIIEMAKKMDANKLQEGITSIQKAIGLFGDMVTKNDTTPNTNTYEPRPVYRRFDD